MFRFATLDIHSACERIAGISNFNINSVYVSLLSKWLLPVDYTNGGLDEVMLVSLEMNLVKRYVNEMTLLIDDGRRVEYS